MVKALELALSKVSQLPEAAQEQIGRELLDRVETLKRLQAEVEIGLRELDAGDGRPLEIEDVIKQARDEYAGKPS